jgi:endogenous inhibitor of DNA gyrase (YacG/DUF329 family)
MEASMLPQAGSARFSKNCPNCGAPVEFKFAQAVQTTCPYCQSILVRTDVDLRKVGTVAEPLVDSSPIQIATEGVFDNKPFVVVGRIAYQYELGRWNEWHIVFNDSTSGWLSDAQLDYAVSFLAPPPVEIPLMPEYKAGFTIKIAGVNYTISTVTRASYLGVEGELPFEYWDKQACRFVDLRTATADFATIDFSEKPPLLFIGRQVDYDELRLKNVKQFEGWS